MADPVGTSPFPGGALRVFTADNPGAFTLDGTRTHVVGDRRPAVIDPGPDVVDHVRAVVRSVEGAETVTLLLTHGHGDHAGAVDAVVAGLADRGVGVDVAGAGHPSARPLADGDAVDTDAGRLVAVHTPGHTPDHLSFHWPDRSALFAGDLLLGWGDTTWVAGYPACVSDYLASLERLRALGLETIVPAHGPPLEDPEEAIGRFEAHRRRRIEQVREALSGRPDADAAELVRLIYGDEVPPGLRPAAEESVRAVLDHVRGGGRR